MLITVVSSLISFGRRSVIEVFPESVRKVWNEWELRVTVLISLLLQIILISMGSRRKYIAKNWIRMILWLAYLGADWIATVSLSILFNSQGDDEKKKLETTYVIMAFWAPFLLVHLGGPDTITAYALEDNELWLRHLLSFILQLLGAIYVFLRSFNASPLNFVALPVFIAGLIKYGERTWVLRSASSDHFRDSMLPRPDPGPNYAKIMDERSSKYSEGFKVKVVDIIEATSTTAVGHSRKGAKISNIDDAATLHDAYSFYVTFKRLFADLILSFQDREDSQSFFQDYAMTFDKAFRIVEIELGFMYDVLYTKAVVVYTRKGLLLRLASLSSTISALIAFAVISKHGYSVIDVSISYLLLVGALFLEMYAIVVLLSSDWTILWLSKHRSRWVFLCYDLIFYVKSFFQSFHLLPSNQRWSNSMAQYNLLTHCINDKGNGINGESGVGWFQRSLDKYWYKNLETVPQYLKEMIFDQYLKKKSSGASSITDHLGYQVLKDFECFDKLKWSVEAEFDQSILLWHIATDICYYMDQHQNPSNIVAVSEFTSSKLLSDYMLYLLVECPFMLPDGIGKIRYNDTYAEAIEFIKERKYICDEYQGCASLLEVETGVSPSRVKGDRSKSVLFDACKLAKDLQAMETQGQGEGARWRKERKWKMVNKVWVEMLCYAASKCKGNYHAKQLQRGGELLTQVWLLMVHLGITDHFQVRGHARVKLLLA